ncbi:DUF6792 domain-containing protein [Mesobacillus zeae]|uniref:DUF6792 domain-containing protein n=1 Tax=Mesobacillus zeae TaxID=1917180 RepID=A0A398B1T8_9BACI|nr:DUF6792 domain-containing protein [Mesobacillus zeae]RID81910.1 hypothetical protein D1970_20675 [Mesobacillus zeae]
MANEELLNSNILRARIAELEYGKDGSINEEKIKRIYFEETGKIFEGEVNVFHSKDLPELKKERDSGFDGSVIHFYEPEKGINQSYTITRGSESGKQEDSGVPLDWIYNGFGIFEGKLTNQYKDAYEFDRLVTKKIENEVEKFNKANNITEKISLEKRGIGHSLGGNHIQLLQIMTGSFTKVYAINDAPPTVYQLLLIDQDFADIATEHFGKDFSDNNQLYSIPPAELKAFAEKYYRERGQNIHHLTSEEDMLFAISKLRGFIDLGTREIYDTDPEFKGIGDIIGRISDEDLRAVQIFMAQFASAYEEGGLDGLIRAMTGYDKDFDVLLDDIAGEWKKFLENPKWIKIEGAYTPFPLVVGGPGLPLYVPNVPHELFGLLGELAGRLGEMAVKIKTLLEELPAALRIVKAALSGVGAEILKEVLAIHQHLINIAKAIGDIAGTALSGSWGINPAKVAAVAASLMNVGKTIEVEWQGIKDKVQNIKDIAGDFIDSLGKSIHAHGATTLASGIAMKEKLNRRYLGNDMILIKETRSGGKTEKIEVNLSSAVRIYQIGIEKYEEQKDVVRRLQAMYGTDYLDDFRRRTQNLLNSISYMEGNPQAYRHLVPNDNVKITGINVHEDIRPLDSSFSETFEEMFHYFQQEFEEGTKLLSKIRSSIEEMFSEEKKIAAVFDYRP